MSLDYVDDVEEGFFWRPNDLHRSYGRVEYDPGQGLLLHLVDTNTSEHLDESGHPPNIDVLYGESVGGVPLTLFDFYPTTRIQYKPDEGGKDTLDGVAKRLLRGVHIAAFNDLKAFAARCSLHGLREFLLGGQYDLVSPPSPGKPQSFRQLSAEVEPGITLDIDTSSIYEEDPSTPLDVSTSWRFDPPIPVYRLQRDYIGPLRDLILFTTCQKSYVTQLMVKVKADGPSSKWVEVIEQAPPQPREESVYKLTFKLNCLDHPGTYLTNWFALRNKVGPVWDQFFGVLDRPELLSGHRLLALMSFTEGYHRALHSEPPLTDDQQRKADRMIRQALTSMDARVRRTYKIALGHVNSQSQRERLKYLTDRATGVLRDWHLDSDLFCARVSETRNWMVHWGRKGPNVVDDDKELFDLIDRLVLVICVNLTLDLGVSYEAVAKINWNLLRELSCRPRYLFP